MTQNAELRNPCEIRIPRHLVPQENDVLNAISAYNADGIIPNITITESGELIDGIDYLEAAIRLGKKVVVVQVASSIKPQINIEWIPIELLDPHPINSQIYGENENVDALAESIAENGLQEIFTCTPKDDGRYTVIHGHRRRLACLRAGTKIVPSYLKNFSGMEDEITALLAGNEYREKTIEQKSREYLVWLEIETERAKSRCGRPGEGEGLTRDNLAKRVGLGSGVTAEHAIYCVKVLDETEGAPVGSVRHQQHQQLKQLLSRTRGVDAAYKLIRPEPPSKSQSLPRWIPKQFERVKIISGSHKGKLATVTIVLSLEVMAHIDGAPEGKRDNIAFRHLEQIKESEKAFTSVAQETSAKQKEAGFGKREQLFSEAPRNKEPATPPLPATITNLNATSGDVLVTEVAIALLKLSPKELHQVMCKVEPELTSAHLEAIWKALQKSLSHKAA